MSQTLIQSNKAVVILHLSDLHFDGDEDDQSANDRRRVFGLLLEKMKTLNEEWRPTMGLPDDFKEAFEKEFGFPTGEVYERIKQELKISNIDKRKNMNLAATLFFGREIANGKFEQFEQMAIDMEKEMYKYLKSKYEKQEV